MTTARAARLMIATTLCAGLAACGGAGDNSKVDHHEADMRPELRRSTIWDLFNNDENPNYSVAVNKYLWNASLEVLDFLPVQAVDPFTGVITTGYGTPPGGGRSISCHDQDQRSCAGCAQPQAVAAGCGRFGHRAGHGSRRRGCDPDAGASAAAAGRPALSWLSGAVVALDQTCRRV